MIGGDQRYADDYQVISRGQPIVRIMKATGRSSALIDNKTVIIALAIDEQDIENDFLIDQLRH
jgi:hypothetical protein